MDVVKTPFKAQQHGFRFVNRFDFPGFFDFNLPFIRPIPVSLGELVYGLCGGVFIIPYAHETPP